MTFLSLHGATKSFNDVRAVDDLSLSVGEGEFVVLLGPSGCGKTTCLRLLAGFERPDEGSIELGGKVLAGPGKFVPPEQRGISVVFQSYALWPHMTVAQNVGYGLKVRGIKRPDANQRVNDILDLVQLGALGKRVPHELSGGQQQRVALARALVTNPPILLLDEPLSNLDTRLREEMRLELFNLQRLMNVTTVYVTHDQAEALSLADRVVVMREGRIEQQGTPEEIYRRPRTSYVARALGPTNVIPVTTKRTERDHVFAIGPSGLEIEALAPLDASPVPPEAAVAFRPSDVDVVLDPDGNGTVESSLFFGTYVQMSIRLDGWPQPIVALAPPERTISADSRVLVTIRPRTAALLPAEGGSRELPQAVMEDLIDQPIDAVNGSLERR